MATVVAVSCARSAPLTNLTRPGRVQPYLRVEALEDVVVVVPAARPLRALHPHLVLMVLEAAQVVAVHVAVRVVKSKF